MSNCVPSYTCLKKWPRNSRINDGTTPVSPPASLDTSSISSSPAAWPGVSSSTSSALVAIVMQRARSGGGEREGERRRRRRATPAYGTRGSRGALSDEKARRAWGGALMSPECSTLEQPLLVDRARLFSSSSPAPPTNRVCACVAVAAAPFASTHPLHSLAFVTQRGLLAR